MKEAGKYVCDVDADERGTSSINQYNLILLQFVLESLQVTIG